MSNTSFFYLEESGFIYANLEVKIHLGVCQKCRHLALALVIPTSSHTQYFMYSSWLWASAYVVMAKSGCTGGWSASELKVICTFYFFMVGVWFA